MYRKSKTLQRLSFSIASLCLLFQAGCSAPTACIRPQLQEEPTPALREVQLYPPGNPEAQYCLTDRGRRDVLVNLEQYRAALESAQTVIRLYNKDVKSKAK